MSSNTTKIIAIIAVVAIAFSAFNSYLILDNINVKQQLETQTQQLDELQTLLNQLSTQQERLDDLQDVLDELEAQQQQISSLETTLSQFSDQQDQITALQNELDQAKTDLQEFTADLSALASQMSTLDQTTTASLAQIQSSVQNLENIISELSNIEDIIDQLLSLSPEEVYQAVYKSVVVIRTPVGQGSGFVFNTSNMILTNYHVVTTQTNIEIEFYDRTRTQATVIGSDAYADIAVLTVSSTPVDIVPLTLGNQCCIGQQVVAIGNPLGLTSSLSVGYISQVNRLLDLDPIIIPVLQLDLTIAAGSSGGPLLDMYGKVVGITNAGTDVGFNFAVPVNIMERVVPALVSEGEYKHPLVGVSLLTLTPDVISSENIVNVNTYQTGLLIVEVVDNYPADIAGLQAAIQGPQGLTAVDIILAVNGHSTLTVEDWIAYVEVEVSPNQSITLTVWRSGVTSTVTLTTTERPPYT
ncbi:MAG: trypsin-like peptidase domain-containing protein [Candidatus Bathyarchaeota archaeon]|nr:trypsin-like peptidase domain-containing protein [Candidatus Bathyarchaeota archaeon]